MGNVLKNATLDCGFEARITRGGKGRDQEPEPEQEQGQELTDC
jgi:hypothetical protein